MNRGLIDTTSIKNHLQAKDLVVCNEISTSLDEFKKFLIQQKKHHEELSNLSHNNLITLRDDLKTVSQQVSSTISNLRQTSTTISRLKTEVLKEEKNASLAHKTFDHGLSIKSDNNELTSYFMKKINEFDTRIRLYKQELEVFEENVYSQPLTPMTPRDLLNILHLIDHDFINLAAQLYTAHESIKTLKSNYLKKYRMCYGSARNPFGDNDDDLYFKNQTGIDNLFGKGLISRGKNVSSFSSTPYGPSPFPTSEPPVTSNSIGIGNMGKVPIIPSSSSIVTTLSSSNALTNPQFGTASSSLQPSTSSLLPQIGSLTSSGIAASSNPTATTTSLIKPIFGFQSSLATTSTTSSIGKIGL
ncbi:unnamed protein product [Schistosoma turkestanicum]|nr:unnamed protein product [Schistosoma turkestanicum]